MKGSLMIRALTPFILLALLGSFSALGQEVEAADKRPAVIFVSTVPDAVRPWFDWLNAGFEIDARQLSEIKTLDDLKAFNVIAVNFLPAVNAEAAIQPEQERFEKLLAEFLKIGGGVMVFCGGSGFSNTLPALNSLLEPYGARVPEEQVTDPEHVFGNVGLRHKGCYTTEIADAPMTRGIERIGYVGEASRADCIETMMPLVIEEVEKWQVVVRGEQSAYSAEGRDPGSTAALKDEPATYAEHPVLAAWREVGSGRLFVHPQNPAFTTATPEVFGNVLWRTDDLQNPGVMQNRSFVMQTARWAAEPSLKGAVLGGFVTDRSFKPDAAAILGKPEKKTDWSSVASGEKLSPQFNNLRGLVGAQSNLSGGRNTVDELCSAARQAGLDFLGITENLTALNPEAWEAFKAACDQNSDAEFLAIPGILAEDTVGNTWFALGWTPFPAGQALTEDGKYINNLYMFWAKGFQNRVTGFARVGSNPNPWYELKQTSAFSIYTYEAENTVDDALDHYFQSCNKMENYIPLSFSLLRDAEAVLPAAERMVNVYAGPSVVDLRAYLQGQEPHRKAMYWASPHPWYLSRGPRLERNGGFNLGNLATDEEKQNIYRYGFTISGLTAGDRIILRDGAAVFREWQASGPSFSAEHTWPHEQVRQFTIEVRRGERTELLSAPVTLHYGRRFMQCADRQNTLPFNYQPDTDGNYYVSGIPIGPHYRSWPPNTLVYGNFKIWLTGAHGIEYQPPMYMTFWTTPNIPFDHPRQEGESSLASYQYPRLSCPGILIVDEVTHRVYPDGGKHTGDCTPPKKTEPLQLFNLKQRRYGLYGMLDQLNGQYVEATIAALQDVNLKSPQVQVSRLQYDSGPQAVQFLEQHTGDRVERFPLNAVPRIRLDDPFDRGDYVGIYPHGLPQGGAHYAVYGSLRAQLDTIRDKNSVGSHIKLTVPKVWQQGDVFNYGLLFTTGGSVPHRATSDYQNVVNFLGIKSGTFPVISRVQGGELLELPIIATVQAEPEKAVILETHLQPQSPLALPLRVRGLQPNWQVVYELNDSDTWRYCGELEGDFYLHLYTNLQAHKVRLGHPVLADNRHVVIALDDPAGTQSVFEVYNPTDDVLATNLWSNPAFLPPFTQRVELGPRESRRVKMIP